MDDTEPAASSLRPRFAVGGLPRWQQWGLMCVGSAVLIGVLSLFHLPAALFLGPMIAAIAMGAGEAKVRIASPLFVLAQAVVGCLMARYLPGDIFIELVHDWPIYLSGIAAVIAVAAGLGILLTRLRVLPGTTAIWGSAPGASTAMILMADAFGADTRLAAFMLYLRVVLVAITASIVSRLFMTGGGTGVVAPTMDWLAPIRLWPFVGTVALIAVSLTATKLFRIPAGGIIVPMFLAIVLQDVFGFPIELPAVLLAASYLVIGWTIGLRFTRPILAHAARAFPVIFASTLALIAICGLFAACLVWFAGIDPLSAYLATSPGGADSVAIIAASSKVDVPFVMAMQAGRFLIVMFTGPALARFIATRSGVKDDKPARQ